MNLNLFHWVDRFFRNEKKLTCKECLKNLELILDGEANTKQKKYFMEHLDECSPCYESYHLEKSVKEVIQTKIEKKPVPPSLAEKIRQQLNQKKFPTNFYILF